MADQLNIGNCFNETVDVYKKNILFLILATIIIQILTVYSLSILAGVLYGGYCLMLLNTMRGIEQKIILGDMFQTFKQFLPLLALFYLKIILIGIGMIALIIPGLLLATMWLYAFFFMVDKNTGIVESLKASWTLVKQKGFWPNFTIFIIYMSLATVSAWIPNILIGWIISLIVIPFVSLLLTSAYIQQTKEETAQAALQK
ncbi:MAG: hypothetical protein GF384_07065 [Elusimicrobia bacterium]|nr:hypothetical protein [Elusimicrobiota bacterium]